MNQPSMNAIRKQAQAGFTLIELIVVIVILGILAATALPRFASLGGDARVSSLNAVRGALSTTVAMAHSQFLLNPGNNNLTFENQQLTLVNGYPDGTVNTATAAGLSAVDYTITASAAAATATGNTPAIPAGGFIAVPVSVAGSSKALTCFISYAQATASAATPPVITPPVITVTATPAGCE